MGCEVTIGDISEYRLEQAKSIFSEVQNYKEKDLVTINHTRHFDIVVDTSGRMLEDALKVVDRGGDVIVAGLDYSFEAKIKPSYLTDNGIRIIGSIDSNLTFEPAIKMLQHNKDFGKIITHSFSIDEYEKALKETDFVFSCVGPNNISAIAKKFGSIPTIISFENDSQSPKLISKLSGNKNSYFGIPDVISSNTAPKELKQIDPLCLVSEQGEFAIEKGNFELPKEIAVYSSKDLEKYWNCKFFLHNTPHASAAFIGKLFGLTYLHEAMRQTIIEEIVISVMNSTKEAMKIKKMAEPEFIEFYSQKELFRFKDKLLYDPIARVGRDPIRKLQKNDRLIQSLKLIASTSQDTTEICVTIKAVLYDALKNYAQEGFILLKEIPTEQKLLEKISGIQKESILFEEIIKQPLVQALPTLA